ncbi:MAG: ribonuclease HI [Rhizobiaceae bacterium]|nr:ribonuclease HI [Rhizobiaceae bacterium]
MTGLVIYCDGTCEPNPGEGGWGFVVYRDGIEIHSEYGAADPSTNNIMEMTGALMALRWVAAAGKTISGSTPRLLCDSQYVVKGCNEWRHSWKRKGWKRGGPNAKLKNSVIANLELWKELDDVLTSVPITLEWVKGHAGILGNERADELAEMGRLGALASCPDDMLAAIRQQLAVPA